jgi:hypothetical protein
MVSKKLRPSNELKKTLKLDKSPLDIVTSKYYPEDANLMLGLNAKEIQINKEICDEWERKLRLIPNRENYSILITVLQSFKTNYVETFLKYGSDNSIISMIESFLSFYMPNVSFRFQLKINESSTPFRGVVNIREGLLETQEESKRKFLLSLLLKLDKIDRFLKVNSLKRGILDCRFNLYNDSFDIFSITEKLSSSLVSQSIHHLLSNMISEFNDPSKDPIKIIKFKNTLLREKSTFKPELIYWNKKINKVNYEIISDLNLCDIKKDKIIFRTYAYRERFKGNYWKIFTKEGDERKLIGFINRFLRSESKKYYNRNKDLFERVESFFDKDFIIEDNEIKESGTKFFKVYDDRKTSLLGECNINITNYGVEIEGYQVQLYKLNDLMDSQIVNKLIRLPEHSGSIVVNLGDLIINYDKYDQFLNNGNFFINNDDDADLLMKNIFLFTLLLRRGLKLRVNSPKLRLDGYEPYTIGQLMSKRTINFINNLKNKMAVLPLIFGALKSVGFEFKARDHHIKIWEIFERDHHNISLSEFLVEKNEIKNQIKRNKKRKNYPLIIDLLKNDSLLKFSKLIKKAQIEEIKLNEEEIGYILKNMISLTIRDIIEENVETVTSKNLTLINVKETKEEEKNLLLDDSSLSMFKGLKKGKEVITNLNNPKLTIEASKSEILANNKFLSSFLGTNPTIISKQNKESPELQLSEGQENKNSIIKKPVIVDVDDFEDDDIFSDGFDE